MNDQEKNKTATPIIVTLEDESRTLQASSEHMTPVTVSATAAAAVSSNKSKGPSSALYKILEKHMRGDSGRSGSSLINRKKRKFHQHQHNSKQRTTALHTPTKQNKFNEMYNECDVGSDSNEASSDTEPLSEINVNIFLLITQKLFNKSLNNKLVYSLSSKACAATISPKNSPRALTRLT